MHICEKQMNIELAISWYKIVNHKKDSHPVTYLFDAYPMSLLKPMDFLIICTRNLKKKIEKSLGIKNEI